MINVELIYGAGFPWYSEGDCHVKGFAHVEGQGIMRGKDLLAYFRDGSCFDDFTSRVSRANGMFSVVVLKKGKAWLGVDRMRTFPLFYDCMAGDGSAIAGTAVISDSAQRIREETGSRRLNHAAVNEFLATGYVTGKETLAEGICQVQASEVIEIQVPDTEASRPRFNSALYSTYRTSRVRGQPTEELEKELEKVTRNVFACLVESLEGRPVFLALSGGFDSRFVAAMLKKTGYPSVTCFSYGREGNPDMLRAREVAERLGFPFIPIIYTPELIGDFLGEREFYEYVDFSSNLSSMFFMQEYFAVKYLKEQGKAPPEAVFIPGHSGDFFGGSQLLKHGLHAGKEELEKTVRRIYDVKYAWFGQAGAARKALLRRIECSILDKGNTGDTLPYSLHEDWDLKEKLAKFIVNSCNVYGWYGFEYRLPLYDYEFQDFFRDLTFGLKANKRLYDDFLIRRVFGDLGLNFPQELQPDLRTQRRTLMKKNIRKILPALLVPSTLSRQDPICYYEITRALRQDLARKGTRIRIRGNSYNSLIVQWYIEYLKAGWHAVTEDLRAAPDL